MQGMMKLVVGACLVTGVVVIGKTVWSGSDQQGPVGVVKSAVPTEISSERLAAHAATIFPTLDACLASVERMILPGQQGDQPAELRQACHDNWAEAQAEHLANAPKFTDMASCAAQFGAENCAQQGSGAMSFIAPMLAGYVMAEVIDEIGDHFENKAKKKAGYAVYGKPGGGYSGSNAKVNAFLSKPEVRLAPMRRAVPSTMSGSIRPATMPVQTAPTALAKSEAPVTVTKPVDPVLAKPVTPVAVTKSSAASAVSIAKPAAKKVEPKAAPIKKALAKPKKITSTKVKKRR